MNVVTGYRTLAVGSKAVESVPLPPGDGQQTTVTICGLNNQPFYVTIAPGVCTTNEAGTLVDPTQPDKAVFTAPHNPSGAMNANHSHVALKSASEVPAVVAIFVGN